MSRPPSLAASLTERLCRPQRIGVFGRRGVGKTTLLTVLYREAAAGRLTGLRLAAGDARTAGYLSDKIQQLESGQVLPATLGETELRFHLYSGGDRIELLVHDYQGEHVALGRSEPIRDFLQECDAVWLCLDATVLNDPSVRWQAEQEVEQVVEDYLTAERAGEPHRPMALVVTKSDLLGDNRAPDSMQGWLEQELRLTQHVLNTHCPWRDVFAISSLGPAGALALQPTGLAGPLTWLGQSLHAQDEARLERLWQIAPGDLRLLERGVRAFARRYPDDPAAKGFSRRLFAQRWRMRLRRAAWTVATTLAVGLGLWGYDVLGEQRVRRVAEANPDDPAAVLQTWRAYQAWHPARGLLRPTAVQAEQAEVAELAQRVRERERQERLVDLRRRADDPDADPEAVWADFLGFRGDYPEYDLDGEGRELRERVKKASEQRQQERARALRAKREQEARLALRDLEQAEQSASLSNLVEQATHLVRQHAGTGLESEFLLRRAGYLQRLDERDYELARDYSARYPNNFFTRKQKYQQYLDRHSGGGNASQARSALARIDDEWDRHDFRAVADHFTTKPEAVKDLRTYCRSYLAAHADGRYRDKAMELLRWCDKVSEPGEYQVTLKSGSFSKKAAYLLSRGAYLSVEIEVDGVRHGPSTIVKRSYSPEWDYVFPRPVRWKLGNSVRIIVTDNYYWKRTVADVTFDDDLAIRKLTGEVEVSHGNVTFASDFSMPNVPKVE